MSHPFNVSLVNDFHPILREDTLQICVFENQTLFTAFHTVIATDNDTGISGIVTFSLNDPTGTFNISRTSGAISVIKNLDRETQSNYTVNITVSDSAPLPFNKETTRSVTILVKDINDNAPVFLNVNQSYLTVQETLKRNSHIYTIVATDKDEYKNGQITMHILNSNCTNIAMWTNGTLYVNG